MPTISRRQLLEGAGGGALAGAFPLPAAVPPQAARPSAPALPPLNRFPRMVQEYFVAQVRNSARTGAQPLAKLKTRADAEAHVRAVRERIRRSFGPMPEKTPLKARITGTVERDAYRIENVVFESRPGFLVTANLYLPKGRRAPAPGVVGVCGHTNNGKAGYQPFAQGLARLGYVCLIFDPVSQGERSQYGGVETKQRLS